MIMFFMTFPPELKSVASASSTGAVTSSARHAQSLSSSLSVNNLLITIKRPFSTKTSFWYYSPFTFQSSYSMNLSTFVQGWFSLPAVHWTIVPGRSSTLHVNRQPQDINTGSPQLQHHRPILHKLIREGSKKNTQPTKNYLDKMRKKAAPSRWIGEFPYWKIRFKQFSSIGIFLGIPPVSGGPPLIGIQSSNISLTCKARHTARDGRWYNYPYWLKTIILWF